MENWPLQPGWLESKLLVQLFMWILVTQTHGPEQVLIHRVSLGPWVIRFITWEVTGRVSPAVGKRMNFAVLGHAASH